MKTKPPNIKYIEWRSPEELYEASLHWISELKFIKDEQRFLDELIEDHTLKLISEENYERSKTIVNELAEKQKAIDPLLKKIINHHNALFVLVDDIDEPAKEKQYKKDHGVLLVEVSEYFNEYKGIKRKIFDLIKAIMKQSKRKRLLE